MGKHKNDWEQRFGAARRATDKAILEECERQIALEAIEAEIERTITEMDDRQARETIAKTFGRPTI
jgi:hypothetical protein